MTNFIDFGLDPVSSEISDLCEISDLFLFDSYFASQSNEKKFCVDCFDVCCLKKTFWLDFRDPQQATVRH